MPTATVRAGVTQVINQKVVVVVGGWCLRRVKVAFRSWLVGLEDPFWRELQLAGCGAGSNTGYDRCFLLTYLLTWINGYGDERNWIGN